MVTVILSCSTDKTIDMPVYTNIHCKKIEGAMIEIPRIALLADSTFQNKMVSKDDPSTNM